MMLRGLFCSASARRGWGRSVHVGGRGEYGVGSVRLGKAGLGGALVLGGLGVAGSGHAQQVVLKDEMAYAGRSLEAVGDAELEQAALGELAGMAGAQRASSAAMRFGGRPSRGGALEVRTIDGSGNNRRHPDWGTPGAHLLRGASGSHYADGISELGGQTRPGARAVSNAFCSQDDSIPSGTGLSDYIWAWGQFIDHDLDLTEGLVEPAPIGVPSGDPFFDPANTGTQVIPFQRALFDTSTGVSTPREQVNQITGFMDGSMVYGSDDERASWLRAHSGGRLKVSSHAAGDLLPFNDGTVPNAGSPEVPDLSTDLFVAGDIRANEQPVLAALHVVFVREHNRLAGLLSRLNPFLSDEELYQRARALVVAEIQHITYEEFLPALLGRRPLPRYRGYNPRVDPGVASAFATAGFRLGHTLLSPMLQRIGPDWQPLPGGALALRDAFFDATPEVLMADGIEPLLRGLAVQTAQELDIQIIDDVRNFLFGPPGAGGFDLAALNLQRGRDMGLPDFNTLRDDYGLRRFSAVSSITADVGAAAALSAQYGDVDDIDAFVGLLIEDDMPGAIVGETLHTVLVEQFERTRDGDRFWYERTLRGLPLALIKRTRLSSVIAKNTSIEGLARNAFFVP